jgi:hypothetical protein
VRIFLLFALASPLFSQVQFYFNDLHYENKVASTNNGGIVFFEPLQLQAKHIRYDEKNKTLEAEHDLCFVLNGRLFVAQKLFIDVLHETGYFIELSSKICSLYIKSQNVFLDESKNICFEKLQITPFDAPPLPMSFSTAKGALSPNLDLTVQNISAQLYGVPVFYLPYLEWNLKQIPSTKVRYRIQYNSAQNPQISLKYPIFVSENHQITTRLDYRIAKGVGFALETQDYLNQKNVDIWTKNFISYDTFYNDNTPKKLLQRYRFQGKLDTKPADPHLHFKVQYDVNTDRDLRQNFPSEQFELLDVIPTQGYLKYEKDQFITSLNVRPKVNNYESFTQQIPQVHIGLNPIHFKNANVYIDNAFTFGYLDYNFSKNVNTSNLNFAAFRLQTTQQVENFFNTSVLRWNPYAKFEGIYFSQSQQTKPNFLCALNYGLHLSTSLQKNTPDWSHKIIPYIHFDAWTKPSLNKDQHYIFSIDDGLYQIQELRTGIVQSFNFDNYQQNLTWDIYGLNFFNQNVFNVPFPKLLSFLEYTTPRMTIKNGFGYNIQKNSLDLFNIETGYTFSKTLAFYLNWLYRGQYEWKKNQKDNYQLDMAYPIDVLAQSPLSDRRSTLLSKIEWHFLPNWTFRFQHHNGFLRKNQPPYFEFSAELCTIFRSAFDVRLSMMRAVNDTQVLFSIDLI